MAIGERDLMARSYAVHGIGVHAVSTLHLLEHISCIVHAADRPQLCSHYLPHTFVH